MGFPQRVWVKKTVHGDETHWLSGKKNVVDAMVSKENNADSLQGHEKISHKWFPFKRCSRKQNF